MKSIGTERGFITNKFRKHLLSSKAEKSRQATFAVVDAHDINKLRNLRALPLLSTMDLDSLVDCDYNHMLII